MRLLLLVIVLLFASVTHQQNATASPLDPQMMDTNLVFLLPHCPVNIPLTALQSPSTFVCFLFVAIVGTTFAVISFLVYNHIRLPNVATSIRTTNISNSMWILYFVGVAVRYNILHFYSHITEVLSTQLDSENQQLLQMTQFLFSP